MNTGQDLIDFINSNDWLKNVPIKYTFMELLRRNIIKPSEIIDAHTQVLNDKCDRYKWFDTKRTRFRRNWTKYLLNYGNKLRKNCL